MITVSVKVPPMSTPTRRSDAMETQYLARRRDGRPEGSSHCPTGGWGDPASVRIACQGGDDDRSPSPPLMGGLTAPVPGASRSDGLVAPAVGGEAVDDEDVDGEDRQRPEGVGGDREQRADPKNLRRRDPEPAAELVAGPDRE